MHTRQEKVTFKIIKTLWIPENHHNPQDPWNSIMSGAAAGAVMAARQGPKSMVIFFSWRLNLKSNFSGCFVFLN